MKSEPLLPQDFPDQPHQEPLACTKNNPPEEAGYNTFNRNLRGAPEPARPVWQSKLKMMSAQTGKRIRGRAASKVPASIPLASKAAPCATWRAQSRRRPQP